MAGALDGGKCNLEIRIEEVDGEKWVRRLYELGTANAEHVRWSVDTAYKYGLLSRKDWAIEEGDDHLAVSNPFKKVLGATDVAWPEAYAAYENFLEKLKNLFDAEAVIVGDLHSLNVRLCEGEDEPPRLEILDGKMAGMEQYKTTNRLHLKLRHEKDPYQRWLLHEYIKHIEKSVGL